MLDMQTSPDALWKETNRNVYQEREIIGNHLRSLPWNRWRKASGLSTCLIWSIIQKLSCWFTLEKNLMSAVAVVSFQLKIALMGTKHVLGRNPRNVVPIGRPSVTPLQSRVTIYTKDKTSQVSKCRKLQEHSSLRTHMRNHCSATHM